MKILMLCLSVCILGARANAQILSGKKESKKSRTETAPAPKEKKTFEPKSKEFISAMFGLTYANKSIAPNVAPYGQALGFRSEETDYKSKTFALNYTNYFHKHAGFRAGFQYNKFGDAFSYRSPSGDSSLNYTRSYSYFAFPVLGTITYGKQVKVGIGAGVVPQIFTRSVYHIKALSTLGETTDEKLKTIQGYQTMNVAGLVSLDVCYYLNPKLGIGVAGVYLKNFFSTYNKTGPYIHKANMKQVNFSIYYAL